MSKTRTTPENKAHWQSLPRSLRHCTKEDALDEAINMTHLLRIFVMLASKEDFNQVYHTEEAQKGIECFTELLLDKLEIAGGYYEFPLTSRDDNAPILAKRENPNE